MCCRRPEISSLFVVVKTAVATFYTAGQGIETRTVGAAPIAPAIKALQRFGVVGHLGKQGFPIIFGGHPKALGAGIALGYGMYVVQVAVLLSSGFIVIPAPRRLAIFGGLLPSFQTLGVCNYGVVLKI